MARIYIYIYIFKSNRYMFNIYIHMYLQIHTYIYIFKSNRYVFNIYIYVFTDTYIYIYVFTDTFTYIFSHLDMHIHTYITNPVRKKQSLPMMGCMPNQSMHPRYSDADRTRSLCSRSARCHRHG